MFLHTHVLGLLLTLSLTIAACTRPDGDEPATMDDPPMAEAAVFPDTTAAAVWAYLQNADYRTAWRMWPGKDALYTGGEPHGMLLTTYANDVAYGALTGPGVSGLRHHSVIVKENYMPDSTLAAVTVMYMVDGYNPEHADWVFAKYQPDGTVDAFGRVPGCTSCHAAGQRYIMTALP